MDRNTPDSPAQQVRIMVFQPRQHGHRFLFMNNERRCRATGETQGGSGAASCPPLLTAREPELLWSTQIQVYYLRLAVASVSTTVEWR